MSAGLVNLAADIERLANGETVDVVQVKDSDNYGTSNVRVGTYDWATVRPLLDYEYDAGGWDGPRAPDLIAWTRTRVIYTHEYDSATSMVFLPRNPPE